MTVVVTGASGFVGRALMARLQASGTFARPLSLRSDPSAWDEALVSASCVVHLAARVHVMQDRAAEPLQLYRAVNTVATLALARRAVRAGVRRQTRAVVAALRAAAGLADYYMFAEDDFVLCPHALRTLQYVIAKTHAYLPGSCCVVL